jgi:hypothetical protein
MNPAAGREYSAKMRGHAMSIDSARDTFAIRAGSARDRASNTEPQNRVGITQLVVAVAATALIAMLPVAESRLELRMQLFQASANLIGP